MTAGRRVRLVLTVALAVAAGTLLSADTLVMRDGRRIVGELVAVHGDTIEFRAWEHGPRDARPLRVSRDQVRMIEFEEGMPPDMRPMGERERGGRPAGLREREVIVRGDMPWTDTGIDVRPGQMVFFAARGEIVWGPGRKDGPEGERNSPNNPNRPIPNRPGGSLIGKVGMASRDFFFVGREEGPVRMRDGGRLFLGINDDYLRDNRGTFTVVVSY